MRDEQVGQAQVGLQLLKQGDDLRLDRHIQRGRGLVEHQKVRLQRQGPRNAHALLLPARQLVRVGVGQHRVEADHGHQ